MPIPQNKSELQAAIQESFSKLKLEISQIPPTQVLIQDLEGHAKNTKMSIHNLVAYLLGWGRLVLKWNHKKAGGLAVDFPETGFKWNE